MHVGDRVPRERSASCSEKVASHGGESDHQAAGVLATEAFDIAGDPAAFPEQVAAPLRRLEPYLENLRPWQPKKIYYFADADNEDIFQGKGPRYSVKDISQTKKQAYWRVALESFQIHETQAKSFNDSLAKMDEAQIEKMATTDFWTNGIGFVLGKSLVGGSTTGDIFEGITPGAISFARPQIVLPEAKPDISAELAGPWSFYAEFRRAHGLTHLPHPEPPEIARVGVIGAGQMGNGIAHVCALAGLPVTMLDVKPEPLTKANLQDSVTQRSSAAQR